MPQHAEPGNTSNDAKRKSIRKITTCTTNAGNGNGLTQQKILKTECGILFNIMHPNVVSPYSCILYIILQYRMFKIQLRISHLHKRKPLWLHLGKLKMA